jgi:TolB-like protein
MSGNPEAAYLGQGVAEDILTALSAFPDLRVLARTTSFATDFSQPAEAIGRRLGARYVLEGSVRKVGDRVRVTARLIDAETGGHVWAETFDEAGKDALAIQAGVAERVLGAVASGYGELADERQRLAWAKNPVALGEYDYYLRGEALLKTGAREAAARAFAVCREGLAAHPDSALLRAHLGFCHVRRVTDGFCGDPAKDVAEMTRLAAEAGAMPARSKLAMWLGRWLESWVAFFREDWPATYAAASKAVALVPNDVWALGDLASLIAPAGYLKEGVEWAERAARIDPRARATRVGLIWAHMLGGDPARAVAAAEGLGAANIAAVAALVRLGRVAEARAANARLQGERGGWTIAQEAALPMRADLKAAYLDDLRKAGMPD